MPSYKTKQVIVIRKDLNMRKGKMVAQGSHASLSFITKVLQPNDTDNSFSAKVTPEFFIEVNDWLCDSFKKICVSVDSEEELLQVHQLALSKGLVSHLIQDSGLTEFKGVKTFTCCAIGPHFEDKFIGITNKLKLL